MIKWIYLPARSCSTLKCLLERRSSRYYPLSLSRGTLRQWRLQARFYHSQDFLLRVMIIYKRQWPIQLSNLPSIQNALDHGLPSLLFPSVHIFPLQRANMGSLKSHSDVPSSRISIALSKSSANCGGSSQLRARITVSTRVN